MIAKPIRALELHYPMIQFLIIKVSEVISEVTETLKNRHVNALDIRKDLALEIRRLSRSKPRESVWEIKPRLSKSSS